MKVLYRKWDTDVIIGMQFIQTLTKINNWIAYTWFFFSISNTDSKCTLKNPVLRRQNRNVFNEHESKLNIRYLNK